ncbi:MAG: hypothetical protein ABIH92_04100 [Nanoarchaeota archaeon]
MSKNPIRGYYLKKLFIAFILTNIIFLAIIIISFSVSYLNYQQISEQSNTISTYLEELDSFSQFSNCENEVLIKASERLDEVGVKIGLLENRFGKNDPRVLEQKEFYSELELKHFNIVKRLESECGNDFITVLFFYTNTKPFDEESENMGFIISTFKNEDPRKIMVYSFDFNLDADVINDLKETYQVNGAPIALVNERATVYVRNINDLKEYL